LPSCFSSIPRMRPAGDRGSASSNYHLAGRRPAAMIGSFASCLSRSTRCCRSWPPGSTGTSRRRRGLCFLGGRAGQRPPLPLKWARRRVCRRARLLRWDINTPHPWNQPIPRPHVRYSNIPPVTGEARATSVRNVVATATMILQDTDVLRFFSALIVICFTVREPV